MFQRESLKGRVAVVTGGVSGIGRGAADALLRAGADRVYALDVNPPEAALPEKITFLQCNVADEKSVVAALEKIPGDIHVLVNSAGVADAARTAHPKKGPHPMDRFTRVININLVGTFNVASKVAFRMSKQQELPHVAGTEAVNKLKNSKERGIIINIASVAAFDGEGGQAAYAASKAGVVGMTLPMARDLSRFGIRVMTIAPGLVKTPMAGDLPDEMLEEFAKNVLTPKRFAHVDEIGHLIVSLVGNSYLNATTIRVDGGIRLSNI